MSRCCKVAAGKSGVRRVVLGAFAAALALAAAPSSTVTAELSQSGGPAVVLNPGGGRATDGSDGLQLVLNGPDYDWQTGVGTRGTPSYGSDQVGYANTQQWCCSGTSPLLNIGGSLYGEAGAASSEGGTSWDLTTLVDSSGAVDVVPTGTAPDPYTATATGDATATMRYEVTLGGLTYQLTRSISYQYPNPFYDESFTVTIPEGNTEEVKFYIGGDASPGEQDEAFGMSYVTSSGLRRALAVETLSKIYIGYGERLDSVPFDGVYVGSYSEPFGTIYAGGDIGIDIRPGNTDVGIDVQWNLGTAAGSHTRDMRTYVGFQGVEVSGEFLESSVVPGEAAHIVYDVRNSTQTVAEPLSFSVALPVGLYSGTVESNCGGETVVSGGVLTVTDASVAAATACQVVVPVIGDLGEYRLSDRTIDVSLSEYDLSKGYAVSTLVIEGAAIEPEFPPPSDTPTEPPVPNVPILPATGSGSGHPLLAVLLCALGMGLLAVVRRA